MHARERVTSNPKDIHILRDQRVAARLVRSANPGPSDLVAEFGAGTGVLTARLAQTGARVLAIEKNTRMISRLERRFGDDGAVRVIAADARTVMLPHRSYLVVANLPYSITTSIVRRMLSPHRTSLQRADLLVEWGFAKRVTQSPPRDFETAWWQARYELTLVGRVRPRSFDPVPAVYSAHLSIRRRSDNRQTFVELRAAYGVSAKAARRIQPRW